MRVARERGADELHIAADWSAYARRREQGLGAPARRPGSSSPAHPGVTILAARRGDAHPAATTSRSSAPTTAPGARPPARAVGAPRKL